MWIWMCENGYSDVEIEKIEDILLLGNRKCLCEEEVGDDDDRQICFVCDSVLNGSFPALRGVDVKKLLKRLK